MNESSEILHSVEDIPMLFKRLFGYEIDFYDAVELLPLILRRTGSIAIKSYLFKGTIVDFELNLPGNVRSIEYVCSSKPLAFYQSYIYSADLKYLINYRVDQTGNIGAYNEGNTSVEDLGDPLPNQVYEINKNVFTLPLGSLINYQNEDNHCLEFNFKSHDVDVLYNGAVVDENGYFKLPEKTLEAVCYYLNYVEMRKNFYRKQADGNMLAVAERDKNTAIAAARTPTSLSVNETDMILNAMTSFNRKRHNRQTRKF